MSKRIYISIDDKDFEKGKVLAEQMGMSVSKLVHYSFMLFLKQDEGDRNNPTSIKNIYQTLFDAINNKKSGEVFIVSSLFEPEVWANLNESEKRSISQQLRHFRKANPSVIDVTGIKVKNNITQYIKK